MLHFSVSKLFATEPREEALDLVWHVLQAVETWVATLQQDERQPAEPSLEIARQVKEQDVQVDENGKREFWISRASSDEVG